METFFDSIYCDISLYQINQKLAILESLLKLCPENSHIVKEKINNILKSSNVLDNLSDLAEIFLNAAIYRPKSIEDIADVYAFIYENLKIEHEKKQLKHLKADDLIIKTIDFFKPKYHFKYFNHECIFFLRLLYLRINLPLDQIFNILNESSFPMMSNHINIMKDFMVTLYLNTMNIFQILFQRKIYMKIGHFETFYHLFISKMTQK